MTPTSFATIDDLLASVQTYELEDRTATGPTFSAVSPQGDVEGRPSAKILQTRSGNGILKTEVKLKIPVYNATTALYDKHRTVYIGILRDHADDPTEVGKSLMELANSVSSVAAVSGSINLFMNDLMVGAK
jgi:hypothetical protein